MIVINAIKHDDVCIPSMTKLHLQTFSSMIVKCLKVYLNHPCAMTSGENLQDKYCKHLASSAYFGEYCQYIVYPQHYTEPLARIVASLQRHACT